MYVQSLVLDLHTVVVCKFETKLCTIEYDMIVVQVKFIQRLLIPRIIW